MVDALTLRSVTVRAYWSPLRFALGTSAAVIPNVPLLLLDAEMEEGVTGRAYIFAYSAGGAKSVAALIEEMAALVKGKASRPQSLTTGLAQRLRLFGVTGAARMALSTLDAALWDAAAIAAELPMASLLGAERRAIPAYDSRGLGLKPPEALADEAEALMASGLKAVKLRVGYPSLEQDVAALRAVRARIGEQIEIVADYNQGLRTAEAIRRAMALDAEGIAWLEEPIRHDDYQGCAEIRRRLTAPLQLGENFNGPEAMEEALRQGACDLVMPDLARIGGVTGWMQAAGIAAAKGVEMSCHLMPEMSVHLLAATPTAHWLEYVDWADAIVEQPLELHDGAATPPDRPGFGMAWDEAKLKRLEAV